MNYFKLFGLEPRLDLDLKDLERRFYSLSRTSHPDVYARGSAEQRLKAEVTSAELNDAYRTLREPLSRAEYVLRENGFPVGEQQSKDVPPELLEEVFELNMALEELRMGDESTRPQLEEARTKFFGMLQEANTELHAAFTEHDSGGGRTALERIRGILNRRRYITNLVREVEKALA